jgi:hypothetical protein
VSYPGVYILGGGGNKYGMRGKKYQKNNVCADKKRRKRKKGQGKRKEKKSDKMTEQEQFFIKLWETWEKNRQ